MKKTLLILCALGACLQGMAQGSKGMSTMAPASPVVNAYISGPANVCPNDANVLYSSSTNWSGFNYWVEFTCGGAGVIAESGTQSYIIYNTGNNNSCHVNWGNYNGSSSWVQVTYHWTVFFVNYSTSAVQNTDIGIIGPNSITAPASTCADDISTNFNVTCNNSLPTGAINYQWSVTNGAIVSGGTSNMITMHAINSNPMVVTVKYTSTCGGYSSPYSYTISREASQPLGAGYILQHLESMGLSGNLLVDLSFPAKPYSYNYHCIVTDPSSSPVNYYGTVAASSTGGIQMSLQAIGSTLYVNTYYTNESCGNYWNYSRGKGGLIVGSHNRTGHFNSEGNTTEQGQMVTVFPIPASDQLNVHFEEISQAPIAVKLTDLMGRVVYDENQSIKDGQNDLNIRLSGLPNGVYFLNLNNSELSYKRKIVVER